MSFLEWLKSEKGFSARSAGDVISRAKRVVSLTGDEVIGEDTLFKLNSCAEFQDFSDFVKSQLRRAVKLSLEFASKE